MFGLSHAVVLPANARRIIVGGQVGIRDDGSIPEDPAEQLTEAFSHVKKALQAAGLGDDAMDYVYKVRPPFSYLTLTIYLYVTLR